MAVAEAIDRQVHADLADAAERRKGQFIRPRHQARPRRGRRAEIDVAGGDRHPPAVGRPDDHAARSVQGVERALDGRIAGPGSRPSRQARRRAPARAAGSRQSRGHRPRCRGIPPRQSDSTANSSSAPIWTPSAASEVAGVGVPSGAATTLVPMPTTTASRSPATASASSRMPASLLPPGQHVVGPFQRKLHMFRSRRPQRRLDAYFLQRRLERKPGGKTQRRRDRRRRHRSTSRTLLARLPRGAIQGRCRRPRPAVCSEVTNQIGPRSPSRARDIASALVEPIWSKAASR